MATTKQSDENSFWLIEFVGSVLSIFDKIVEKTSEKHFRNNRIMNVFKKTDISGDNLLLAHYSNVK